jgi:hypothetical protein
MIRVLPFAQYSRTTVAVGLSLKSSFRVEITSEQVDVSTAMEELSSGNSVSTRGGKVFRSMQVFVVKLY